jgi:hypothetical protein
MMKMWLYAAVPCIGLGDKCAWAGIETGLTQGKSEGGLQCRMFGTK